MRMYCAHLSQNSSMSRCTSSGRNAMKSATTSKYFPSSAALSASTSPQSAMICFMPSGAGRFPRLSSVTSQPCFCASAVHAELMVPVPPKNKAFILLARSFNLYYNNGK